MNPPATGAVGNADERKKSPGALWPHALTARMRTHALNPAGNPLALTLVVNPTFAAGAMFAAPGVDPAETTYDVAPGTAGQLTVAVPPVSVPVTTGADGGVVQPPPVVPPIVKENGGDGAPGVPPTNAVTWTEKVPTVPGGIGMLMVDPGPAFTLATSALPAKKSRRCDVAATPATVLHVRFRKPPLTMAVVTVGCPGAPPPDGGGPPAG